MSHILNRILISICFLFLLQQSFFAQPQIKFEGDYNYVLNKPLNGVFAITPDKRLGVTLTNVINSSVSGQITSFDPITGQKFDSESVGFGPLDVGVIPVNGGYRVAVLISQGGPRAVKIYDMNQSGILTFRAQTQLSNDGADSSSNLALSANGRIGFARIIQNSNQLVSFSLDDGAVLNRLNGIAGDTLKLYEDSGRRLLAVGRPSSSTNQVVFIDVQNPAQMVNLGQTELPGVGYIADIAFSADGNYIFAGGSAFSVINTANRQVTGSLSNYGAQRIRLFEGTNTRTAAISPGFGNGIALINANDVSNLQVINEISFTTTDPFIGDFTFSPSGKRLFLNRENGIRALEVPSLRTAWENILPVSLGFRIEAFGQPERVIGASGSNNSFEATIYSMPDRINRRSNFDADSKTDISVFRPNEGDWYWLSSSNNDSFNGFHFGQNGDVPVAADYDNDKQTDFAVYRPSEGNWYILQSSTNTVRLQQLGLSTDEPIPGDYDGDGKADISIFRRNPNRWYVLRSSDGALEMKKISGSGGKPINGDFDGDGKNDFAVFYNSGQWQIIYSSTGSSVFLPFGQLNDIPLSGDWDNDGKYDLAVFRPSEGVWYILQSFYGFRAIQFGISTDIPIPADYNGDGNVDIAVFRPSTSAWYILQSSSPNYFFGGVKSFRFGLGTDVPLGSR